MQTKREKFDAHQNYNERTCKYSSQIKRTHFMQPKFLDDVSAFIARLKNDSEALRGNQRFEAFMRGISDGSIDFRWGFGTRSQSHSEPINKPSLMWVRLLISGPFIYLMFIPIAVLDLTASLFQSICFRLWGLPQVKRSTYVVMDRHRLSYLTWFQKINCIYCGYANGVLAYAKLIAGETERYWCPVKHETDIMNSHSFYIDFADFGDREGLESLEKTAFKDWKSHD